MDPDQSPSAPAPSIPNTNRHDLIKILLCTDCHVGYAERDPVRGLDSINTFREILELAKEHEVDFILMAGDLFHENKPSRGTLHQVMALLREYTLGDKPVSIELISDPDEGKAPGFTFPAVNYEDPNFNVSIPVFSIHGNHDDPQGAGPEGALSALDVLSVAGLVNYFGKVEIAPTEEGPDAENMGIRIKPVLLQKGDTKLALYGVGNIKDQRLHYELRANRVRMYRPSEDQDDWFNILLVHQNRVAHGPQNSVPEGMFDDSVHLVVWGHEHDCRIQPETVPEKQYRITQPGSSIATSLSEGESIQKHVGLLKVQGTAYEMVPLPLKTVRPFVHDDVNLSIVQEEEGHEFKDKVEVNKYLRAKIEELIERANSEWEAKFSDEDAPKERMLPLVRLRVEYTGFPTGNPLRLGQEFTDRVANPKDLIQFYKRKKAPDRSKTKVTADLPDFEIDDSLPSEKLRRVRVQTLVQEYLQAQKLEVLVENGLEEAVLAFVDKEDIHAITDFVTESLESITKNLKRQNVADADEDDLDDKVAAAKEQGVQMWNEELGGRIRKGKSRAKGSESDRSVDSMEENDFDDDESVVSADKGKGQKAAPAKGKAPATGSGKKKKEELFLDSDDDEVSDEPPPPPKKTGRAAALVSNSTKKAPAKTTTKKAPASLSRQSQLTFAPSQPAARKSTRATAPKKHRDEPDVMDISSGSDEFEPAPKKVGRKR